MVSTRVKNLRHHEITLSKCGEINPEVKYYNI